MKKLSDYVDPTLWLLAILALAAVYLLVQLNDTSTAFHRANVQAAQQYEKLSNESIEKERRLREEIDLLAIQHRKEKQDDQIKNEAAIAALRAGTQRVSVAVRACSTAASSTDSAAASRDTGARAELAPEVAADLANIAADGDTAIKDLNTCIATYNKVRDTLNVQAR